MFEVSEPKFNDNKPKKIKYIKIYEDHYFFIYFFFYSMFEGFLRTEINCK